MEKEIQHTGPEQQPAGHDSQHNNPKNPFKDDAPEREPSPEEEAALEQQRKEALTERD